MEREKSSKAWCKNSRAAVAPLALFPNESSRSLSSASFRKTKGGEMLRLPLLRSHSSLMALKCIIMQIRQAFHMFTCKIQRLLPVLVEMSSDQDFTLIDAFFKKKGEKDSALCCKIPRGYCISHAGFQTNKRVVLLECNKLRIIRNRVVVISLKLRDGNKTYIMFSEGCFAFKQLLYDCIMCNSVAYIITTKYFWVPGKKKD
ncbi:hypothetical protein E2320_004028 [Naja naja]|nr:hypothetical protein E2320_004028 [Naja naja]